MRVCSQVGENFVPPLLDAVLIDYQRNVPAAREPEVLSTMATIVNKLGGHITTEIPQIFDAVFECTLNMINKVRPCFGSDALPMSDWIFVTLDWIFFFNVFFLSKKQTVHSHVKNLSKI